ncbi:hypothetical protein JIG36_15780 [Actinoplanes sp. LDG1-06]|uniref:Uncharacterized protein n=1 Tax=Paractinoplanes ovalisporus TaxID=2810368 RepID=A0ABS2AB21_9ACTN|nr:hypothetical protein [Actinoplanes ovalisporus]MBM2617019.1 hypothetical protein [Actinoplanes ovalisporus]
MRNPLRAGAVALATAAALLGGALAAQAAPAEAAQPTLTVGPLIFNPREQGDHTGSIDIAIKNNSDAPLNNGISITEPVANTFNFDSFDGADGCIFDYTDDNRTIVNCGLALSIGAGETEIVTIGFRSSATPQPYAQIASTLGHVRVGTATADFPALFRSTTGSLHDARPYVPATVTAD